MTTGTKDAETAGAKNGSGRRMAVLLERVPSGAELARKAGLSQSTVNRFFTANEQERRWPDEESAKRMAAAMGCSVGEVYELVELKRRVRQRQLAGAV